jgi:hypothetical protein
VGLNQLNKRTMDRVEAGAIDDKAQE